METIRGRKMSYGNCVTAERNPSRNVIKLGKPLVERRLPIFYT